MKIICVKLTRKLLSMDRFNINSSKSILKLDRISDMLKVIRSGINNLIYFDIGKGIS